MIRNYLFHYLYERLNENSERKLTTEEKKCEAVTQDRYDLQTKSNRQPLSNGKKEKLDPE